MTDAGGDTPKVKDTVQIQFDKLQVWADLKNAITVRDERPSRSLHNSLMARADEMKVQTEDEFKDFMDILQLDAEASHAQRRSKSRSDAVIAHEAIENGLKALLIDSGVPKRVYWGHDLGATVELGPVHISA